MKMLLGHDYFDAKQGRLAPVEMDTSRLINAHMLILGSTGVGKSHTIRRLCREAMRDDPTVRFHVFDVHGDLDLPGASTVSFSEMAPYGLNPLRINPSPEFGGVRKAVQTFIRVINQASSTKLGVKQEAVLRNLLYDVFRDYGFDPEHPSTWAPNAYSAQLVSGGADNRLYLTVPLEEKDQAKALGARWDGGYKLWWVPAHTYAGDLLRWKPAHKARQYPSLTDVVAYARRLYEERFLGSDQAAVAALQNYNRIARALQKKALDVAKAHRQYGHESQDKGELDSAAEKALAAYQDYVKQIRTGYELETLLKYDSSDVLKSVLDRLTTLRDTGIYKATAPAFDKSASVWRYKLNALGLEEKRMLILFRMEELFYRAVESGEQPRVRDVIILDELSSLTTAEDEKGEGIIGVVARQARKFGLALWAADQTPVKVPESLISAVGTKVVLGLDERYWNESVTKLRVELKLLQWVAPRATMAVQMKEIGSLKNRWRWVQLDRV